MTGRRIVAAAMTVAALVLAACGGDDGDDAADDPATTEAEIADGDDESVAPATLPSGDDSEAQPPADEADITAPEFEVTNDGSCSVTITGDKEVSYEGGGTVADVLISYWLTEEEAEFVGSDFTFLFNCSGQAGDSLSIFNGPAGTAESIPQAPGTYPLTGGLAGDGLFAALVTIADSETNWGVTDEGGTIDITRFDDERITGTFTIPMEDTLAELSGAESEGTILVEGTFDFPNPNA